MIQFIIDIIIVVLKIIIVVLPLIIAVAYLTLLERKIMGSIHRRKGPNVVGIFGLLQPFADAVKLVIKETILPSAASKFLFIAAPIFTFFLSLMTWAVIPFNKGMVLSDLNVGLFYLLAISSLGVYGIIVAGWASNSKYAFLGALRSAAQMISYEVSMGLIIMNVLLCAGSLNLTEIVLAQKGIWYVIPLFPLFIMFFISILAETNRAPFDLPEAEGELVAGYNIEYSAMGFALFFLGEYSNILLMSALTVILFLGGWLPIINIIPFTWIPGVVWFGIKLLFILFCFVWIRATLPRYRYDQLMRLGWKVFLPLSLGWVILTSGVLIGFNWLP